MSKDESILKEAWQFARERKKYWLLPILIALLIIGIIMIAASSSPLSPFIYALF